MSSVFPGIPKPGADPQSQLSALGALKESVELLTGERGDGTCVAILNETYQGALNRIQKAQEAAEAAQIAADASLKILQNLADLDDVATARRNLGIGTGRGHISGLVPSMGTDPTKDIRLSPGTARDDGDVATMELTASLEKATTGTWVEGNGQGGLDTGTVAANTWYHIWAIERPDTHLTEMLFSLSASAPLLPANYTRQRRVGSFLTDGSFDIKFFHTTEVDGGGVHFTWNVMVLDGDVNDPGTLGTLVALTVPPDIEVEARIAFEVGVFGRNIVNALITETRQSDVSPTLLIHDLGVKGVTNYDAINAIHTTRRVNASRQLRFRLDLSNSNVFIHLHTLGWNDSRVP